MGVEAGGEAVSRVVDTGWVRSATAEATVVEVKATPVPHPTVPAGRVPYLRAAVNLRKNGSINGVTLKVAAPSGRGIARTIVRNVRTTGQRNRASGRKTAVNARRKVQVADRSGVNIMTVAT
jgi:hypothetical protein